jgi:hypothetical protein
MTNIQYYKILVAEYILCYFSAFGMTLSIILYENKDVPELIENQDYLLIYNLFCNLALFVGIYFRYKLYLNWF